MTHSLPQAPDATFAEPQPDGHITVVFKDPRQHPQVYRFAEMNPEKGWTWREDEGRGRHLVIRMKDDSRFEIPEIGILMVHVLHNSPKYTAWQKMCDAAAHVLQLEHHLQTAKQHMIQARKEWAACRDTSSSS